MAIRYLSGINVDSNTMFVDDANNRVGVGTASPSYKLDVNVANNSDALRVQQAGASRFILNGDGVMTWGGGASNGYLSWDTNLAIVGGQTNNSLALYAGAGEKVRITTGGNVGIGTTSPSDKLTVSVGNVEGIRVQSSNSGFVEIGKTGGARWRWTNEYNSANLFELLVNDLSGSTPGQNVFTVNGVNGNIGIGTISPSQKLAIVGASDIVSYSNGTTTGYLYGDANGIGLFNGATGSGTGIYARTSNILDFYYGSSIGIRLSSTGNVGIGTTSPAVRIDYGASVNQAFHLYTSGTDYYGINMTQYDSGPYSTNIFSGDGGQIKFRTATGTPTQTTRMTITQAGNVGIGTTGPVSPLDVNGIISSRNIYIAQNSGTYNLIYNASNSVAMYLGGSADNSNYYDNNTHRFRNAGGSSTYGVWNSIGIGVGTTNPVSPLNINNGDAWVNVTDTLRGLQFGYAGPSHGSYRAAVMGGAESYGGTDSGMLTFHTQNGYAVSAIPPERMRITSGGSVGIGTTSPAQKLDVSGSIKVSQDILVGTAGVSNNIYFADATSTQNVRINSYTDNTLFFDNFNGQYNFRTTNSYVSRLYIANNGLVGIGTTSPGAKLDVRGRTNIWGEGTTSATLGLSVLDSPGSNYNFYVEDNGGAFLRGNVRIGNTTDNGYKLDVAGDINTSSGVYRIGGNTILSGTTNVAVGSAGGTGSVALRTTSGDGLVLSGSSVGIGTTSPTSKLEVFDGDISVTTSGSFSFLNLNRNFIPNSSGVLLGGIKYRGYSTGTTYQSGAYIYSYSSAAWTSTSSPGYLSIQTTPSGSTTPVERMLVASNGALKLNAYGSGSNTGTATQRLAVDASGNVIEIPIGSGPVDGNGTANYVTKWSDADTITNSIIYDNGSAVGIGTTTPEKKLDVNGSLVVGMSPPAPFWNAKFKDYSDGSAIYISSVNGGGGKYIAGNAYYNNSLQWWSDKTTASAINLDNGAVVFYTNSGLTPNTDFIPSERMRITSAGRVGIGTTSPSELFAVAGNIELTLGVDRYIYIGSATNYYYRLQSVGDDFQIQEVTTPRLTIKYPNGNVGIGTTAPGYRLHVKDSTNIGTIAIGNDTYPGLIYSNAGTGEFRIDNRSSAAAGYITFYPNGQAATIGSEAMRITTAGNVGIGTTSPTHKLHVLNAGAAAIIGDGNDNYFGNYSSGDYWDIGNLGATGNVYLESRGASTNINGHYRLKGAGSHIWSYNGGSNEVMRTTSAGNVGIGTTSPSAKLQVSGDIASTYGGSNGYVALQAGTSTVQGYVEWFKPGPTRVAYMGYNDGSTANNLAITLENSANFIVNGGNLGIGNTSPTQKLHVTGSVRVTGAYYDSNNEAGTSGQVLSSTGSGTDWVTPATTTASSLYDLLPAARVAYNWTGQVVNDTWVDIFSAANNVLTTGTWMVQMYISDFAAGGGHYYYTYTGTMQWYQENVNQGGESAASEIYLHRMGHAANASVLYLRTTEMTAVSGGIGKLQVKANYSNTSNTTINFKFVKIF